MTNVNSIRGWGKSYDKERLERMEKNRQKKLKKQEIAENGEVPFSKEEGRDYFVELCAAEETITHLQAKLAAKEKEFNDYRRNRDQDKRDPFSFIREYSIDIEPR